MTIMMYWGQGTVWNGGYYLPLIVKLISFIPNINVPLVEP